MLRCSLCFVHARWGGGGGCSDAQPAYPQWILQSNGKRELLYTTASGALIKGDIFTNSGVNLSTLHRSLLDGSQPAGAQHRAWEVAAATPSAVTLGQGANVVYVVFDPMCPHCKSLLGELEALKSINKLGARVKLLPVDLLSPQSTAQAREFLAKNGIATTSSAIQKIGNHTPKAVDSLAMNKNVMSLAGVASVPLILYKDAGGTPRALVGNPGAALTAILASGAK